jgi:hypothetical protein
MNKVIKQVTKVIKSLDKKGVSFVSEDNCEDSLDYLDIEGHEVIVGDDSERETWNVTLNKVSVNVEDILVEVLGPPTRVFPGQYRVLNWEPTKNVLIVYSDNSIEFTQYYSKR